MVRTRSGIGVALCLAFCLNLSAQEDKSYTDLLGPLEELLERSVVYAILIDLEVYNINNGEKNLLAADRDARFTIHGSPVSLRYVVANVVIEGGLTPYSLTDDRINLVTQSEVWIKTEGVDDVHVPMFNNLKIDSGETIYYFPLGLLPETARSGFTIEIPIQVIAVHTLDELIAILDKINQND